MLPLIEVAPESAILRPFSLAYHSDRSARQRAIWFWLHRERKSCPWCLRHAARWPKAPPINGCQTPQNNRTASSHGRSDAIFADSDLSGPRRRPVLLLYRKRVVEG